VPRKFARDRKVSEEGEGGKGSRQKDVTSSKRHWEKKIKLLESDGGLPSVQLGGGVARSKGKQKIV